ncbi:hypothetical protein M422DRAFT_76275 [Sphaerobolus stellatus SS14]|uniref:Lanosterol 14-alpha-demethylase n=1 Tax=Sphaerobolus stellatus (strain SS14) TaxID=990650 RepID=A0A0C9V3B8_SPHS4|nr:hypothetical protein M422DRAFT_76275 [Sphaerobolus stellatus SS14]
MSNYSSFPFVESLTRELWPLDLSNLVILFAINLPIIAIAFTTLAQLIIPQNPNEPPVVFHWLPYLGSAIEYGKDPVNFLKKCREKHGNVFTFILIGRRVTVALGPKGSNFILGGKLSDVSAEEVYTPLTTPVFGQGVVYDCPNHMLMEQKKFVKVGLSLDNLRAYTEMIENEVLRFLETDPCFYYYQTGDVDKWETFHAYRKMVELIILTASLREAVDGAAFAQRYRDLDGGFTPLNMIFPNLPFPSYRKRDIAQKAMSDFYVGIIEKRREEGRLHEDTDMIASLCTQSYKDGRQVTDREVAHMMTALLMAGQHTSSTSGVWALMNIAANPQIAEALYQEQLENFVTEDGTWRTMTFEQVKKIPLMDAAIRETLRRHHPIHSIMRKVISDMPVPPTLAALKDESRTYVVPKGDMLLASPAVAQMDASIWKNPEVWDPYRWLDPSGAAADALVQYDQGGEKVDYGFGQISKGTESVYQPFGAGRHRCIGEQFAYLQLSTILATLVRHLELRMDEVPKHNYQTMVTQPQGNCPVRYRKRLPPKRAA